MNKEFIPHKQALELKELGFDEPFNPFDTFYYRNGDLCEANKDAVEYFNSFNDEVILAPLYQQAFRWFREKHNLFSSEVYDRGLNTGMIPIIHSYSFRIINLNNFQDFYGDIFDTYKEAELACLNKLIQIIKNK